jgi:glutathione S-transferase
MINARHVTLFHAPQTRSTGILCLLEELGADYDLRLVNFKAGEHKQPDFLAINPMGKVPVLQHGDAIITEQAAISIYLADLYPENHLAPAIGDPLRGPYLRWMVFYGSSFEPAMVDLAEHKTPSQPAMSPYGSLESVLATLNGQLSQGPYFLGQTFTALDVLWGNALGWALMVGLLPNQPILQAYVDRISARPAIQRARAKDAELVE